MQFTSTEQLPGRVVERRFTVTGAGGRPVPGVLWTPAEVAGPLPLVILGHGGSQSKDAPSVLANRDDLTGRRGIGLVVLDGPVHGERGGVTGLDDPRLIAMWHTPRVIDDMVEDWTRTLDALLALDEFDARAIGYRGLSMGTTSACRSSRRSRG